MLVCFKGTHVARLLLAPAPHAGTAQQCKASTREVRAKRNASVRAFVSAGAAREYNCVSAGGCVAWRRAWERPSASETQG